MMGAETIRSVVLELSIRMKETKELKTAVESVRNETAKLAPEQKRFADATAVATERIRQAAVVEKERLGITRDQLTLESKREATKKAQIDLDRQSLRLQEQQMKVSEAALNGAGTLSPRAPAPPGRSALSTVGDIGKVIAAVLSGPGLGAAALEHLGSVAHGTRADVTGKGAFADGTFTKAGASFLYEFDRLGKEFRKYAFGTNFKPSDVAFSKELGYTRSTAGKLQVRSPEDVEMDARQPLLSALERETSMRQRNIDSLQSIISTQYKLQHLDEEKIRQSAKALSGSTALERDAAMRLSSRIGIGGKGIDSLTKDQRDSAFSNPILGPLLQQMQEDKYRKGPTAEEKNFTAQLYGNLGLKERVDAANQASAAALQIDQKVAVTVTVQQLDQIVLQIKDKLLPEIMKLNTEMIAQSNAQLRQEAARRRNASTAGGPAAGGGF